MANRSDHQRPELRIKDNHVREKKRELARYAAQDSEIRTSGFSGASAEESLDDCFDYWSFDDVKDFFLTLQHAYVHRDITRFLHVGFDEDHTRQILLIANKFLVGRQFDRVNGRFVIKKEGRLSFDELRVVELYEVLIARFDADVDIMPDLLPTMKSLLGRQLQKDFTPTPVSAQSNTQCQGWQDDSESPMFQTYTAPTRPSDGPPRVAMLRAELAARGLSGFLVPRSDAHQGEYVSPRDARLEWLTGFTGSAGFCVVLPELAGVFIDGRYTAQVRGQIDLGAFTPVDWPTTQAADWLKNHAPRDAVIGFDPWLHTPDEISRIEAGLVGTDITLKALDDNPLDAVWKDQPTPASGKVRLHPLELAGKSAADKRADLAAGLQKMGSTATVITLADSIAWLMNWRGSDIIRNPVVQGFAILHDDARLDLFLDPAKVSDIPEEEGVTRHPVSAFPEALSALNGATRFDPATAPVAVQKALAQGVPGADPCLMAKAVKNAAELEGMRAAHRRDGAAMVEFLCWFDAHALDGLTEIDMAKMLESFRVATGHLLDLSFDSISSTGPNAAINHYRVTEDTNRVLEPGDLFLIDSGGQYPDGTTDITRTLPVGAVDSERRDAYTRVLQGMIAISRARFPRGVGGGHLDALARYPLWLAGQDYDHGTGHGVGAALSVHEGPVRISRISTQPLEPGMILSNEPGYYRAGGWGIRIENLIVVREAGPLGDNRKMLDFETITLCPIDKRLIVASKMSPEEIAWLDAYHAWVEAELAPLVSAEAAVWLTDACAPLNGS